MSLSSCRSTDVKKLINGSYLNNEVAYVFVLCCLHMYMCGMQQNYHFPSSRISRKIRFNRLPINQRSTTKRQVIRLLKRYYWTTKIQIFFFFFGNWMKDSWNKRPTFKFIEEQNNHGHSTKMQLPHPPQDVYIKKKRQRWPDGRSSNRINPAKNIISIFWEFFITALADGFSLEFERQQVSPSIQDSPRYFEQS